MVGARRGAHGPRGARYRLAAYHVSGSGQCRGFAMVHPFLGQGSQGRRAGPRHVEGLCGDQAAVQPGVASSATALLPCRRPGQDPLTASALSGPAEPAEGWRAVAVLRGDWGNSLGGCSLSRVRSEEASHSSAPCRIYRLWRA